MSRPARICPAAGSSPTRRILVGALLVLAAAAGGLAGRTPAMASGLRPGLLLGGPAAYAGERGIATERGQPLLLFFSLAGCTFCESLRSDQLRHAHARREGLGIRLVELRMDDERPIPGVEPARSPREIARALQVRIAPTVLFLDGEREVAERLVGYPSPDFYGAYLDERIEVARAGAQRAP